MSKNKRRLDPTVRKDLILDAALELAQDRNYTSITRDEIAERAGVSVGLVTKYFTTMPQLKRDVMRAAIRSETLAIIAHGVAIRDPHALKAPAELQQRAVASLAITN